MRKPRIDLTGQKFGRLTAVSPDSVNKHGSWLWLCRCECGNTKIVDGSELRRGNVKSCGCLNSELARDRLLKHGFSNTKIYKEWTKMNSRCKGTSKYNELRYKHRGIKVCDRWSKDFKAFYDDVSKLPHFEDPGYSLDRIDNNRNYEPENVRWANATTQANNRSNNIMLTYNGETYTMAEWARKLEMNYSKLQWRLLNGWTVERALSTK